MNKTLAVQYALLCLREIDQHETITIREISELQGIPLHDCQDAVERLVAAGYLETTGDGRFSLSQPLDRIHSLELIQAMYAEKPKVPAFKMLFQSQRLGLEKALEAVRWSRRVEDFPSDGGVARG